METREDAMETREDAREDASIDGAREEGGGEDDARDAETVEYFMEDVKVVDEVGTLRGLDLARYARLRTLRVVRQREVRSMVGLEACVGLRSVTVAECALTSWEGTEACEGLEELYVYGNAIRSIEGMWESGGFRRLQKLWVNDNALREIDAVTSLESLRELNAARNELRAVPRARSLEWLNVAGNPIRALEDVEPAQWTASLIFRDDVHGACALCRVSFTARSSFARYRTRAQSTAWRSPTTFERARRRNTRVVGCVTTRSALELFDHFETRAHARRNICATFRNPSSAN